MLAQYSFKHNQTKSRTLADLRNPIVFSVRSSDNEQFVILVYRHRVTESVLAIGI